MSARDLVNAIIAGEAIEIENAFNSAMAEKLSVGMDNMREQVAAGMFNTEETEQLDEDIEYLETCLLESRSGKVSSKYHRVEVSDKDHFVKDEFKDSMDHKHGVKTHLKIHNGDYHAKYTGKPSNVLSALKAHKSTNSETRWIDNEDEPNKWKSDPRPLNKKGNVKEETETN